MGDGPSRFSDADHPECPGDDRQDSKPADTHEHDEETRAVGAPPHVEAHVHKERRDSGRSNCDEEKGSASPSLSAAAASAPIEKEEKMPAATQSAGISSGMSSRPGDYIPRRRLVMIWRAPRDNATAALVNARNTSLTTVVARLRMAPSSRLSTTIQCGAEPVYEQASAAARTRIAAAPTDVRQHVVPLLPIGHGNRCAVLGCARTTAGSPLLGL